MKLLIYLFLVESCFGQIITTGLKAQYDMVTVAGSSLTDLSGNGNNGTLHGTTQTSLGTTFNGSSDYVSMPLLVGNGSFTAIACYQKNSGQNGFIWDESDGGGNNIGINNNSTTAASVPTSSFSGTLGADWRCYFGKRDQNQTLWGIIDSGQITSGNIGSLTFTATGAGLGAQIWAAGQNTFWLGQLGYFVIYNRALNPQQINQNYAAIRTTLAVRGIHMKDVAAPLYPAKVWTREGTTNLPISDNQVIYTATDCVIVGNPCFQIWGTSGGAIVYSESSDGLIWQATQTVVTAHIQSGVCKVGSTYHLYATDDPGSKIDHYTGSAPNSFTLAQSNVITEGANGTFDHSGIFTPSLYCTPGAFYMVYSASGNATGQGTFVCGGATSTDGATWTKTGAVTGFTDPSCNQARFGFFNNTFYAWINDNGLNFYRIQSSMFQSIWQGTSPGSGFNSIFSLPTFQATAPDEIVQMADPCVIQVGSNSYMFYEAGGTGGTLTLKLAIATTPIGMLIQTGEGMTADVP